MEFLQMKIDNLFQSFALIKPQGQKKVRRPGKKFSRRLTESVLNKILFYVEADKKNRIDLIGETLTFTNLLLKIKVQNHHHFISNYFPS